ncbi:hypothetical protein D3C80_2024850 [compost metagenome]
MGKVHTFLQGSQGSISSTVIQSLYIPATAGVVVEDLIIIDDMEKARMLINNSIYGLLSFI